MRTAFTELLGIEAPLVGFNRSPGVVTEVSRAGGLGVLAATVYTASQLDAQLHWIEERLDGRPYGVDLLIPAKMARGSSGDAGDAAALVASLRAQIPEEHLRFVDDLLARYQIPELPSRGDGTDGWVAGLDPAGVDELLDVVFAHRAALVASALGSPPPSLVTRAKEAGVAVAALLGTPEHARRHLAAGVDVLVAQGTEAGGHTGTIATMVLTPEVVDLAGEVPVLAAGGIANGRQMAAALALGAAGVWCGSVWLSAEEEIAQATVKRKFLAATSSDTVRSRTLTGKPARQLRTAWHEEWDRPGSPGPLPLPLQPMLVSDAMRRIARAAESGHPGATELESFFIGQVVGGFTELRPAGEIARSMIDDCRARLVRLGGLASD